MATNTKLPPPASSNHVITGPPKGVVGGNRKKQKRRAKQAAKAAGHPHAPPPGSGQPADLDYDEDPLGYGDEDDYDYSDADAEVYDDHFMPPRSGTNGYGMPGPGPGKKNSKKKKSSAHEHSPYNPELLGPLSNPPPPPPLDLQDNPTAERNVWNTSTQQERENIKDFWLSLSEEERKSLLKIEKEAVLKKMKQQQKHSCSCTVCGRKRTAIEEELEVLYEGYYEELEQYAHHDHPPLPTTDGMMPDPLQHRSPHPLGVGPPQPYAHRTSHLHEHFDEDDFSEDEDEEEYSDDDYSDDEPDALVRSGVPDFFNFGQNLTVKGILTPWLEKLKEHDGLKGKTDNLLTVADDLLKNDGRKFIEMMEQLAERRMARESEAEYAANNPSHPGGYPPGDPGYNHEDPLAAGDDFDDDEASYDSQEDYDDDMDDEDEMVSLPPERRRSLQSFTNKAQSGLTEEQRVQEGRRMFQIFAARMFEQRVLTAYKEKVAHERQQKLLEELEDETKLKAQQEAKKQRDAQKKKDKKKQQQQAKAEEKARKDAEKAAEEKRVREEEEKKLEEQRRKKEEQRKKKEEEKKKQDEERVRKEAEKLRRQQEEQQKREEAERKARELKAAEKAKKDEVRKREREEREAREKEARERKAQEEKEKKEREAKTRAEMQAKEREKTAQQAAQPPTQQQPPQVTKRPSQAGMVAVPGVHPKQTGSGISSPHPSIATPAIPKAPTPAKQRQASQQGSHASSPKQSQSQVSSVPSKSSSPNSAGAAQQHQPIGQPKTIMQKAGNQQQAGPPQPPHQTHATSPLPQHQPIQPPPGMSHPNHPGVFSGMPPMGYGFQGPQGPMIHGNMGQRGPMPMYPQHGAPPMGVPNNRFGLPNVNGMNGPPPGMMPPQGRGGMAFPFDAPGPGQPLPGFGPQQTPQQPNRTPPIGQPPLSAAPGADAPRAGVPTHSRQHSASDKERFEAAANQPIARPAPIQRPSSVKPQSQERRISNTDLDDLSKHLGSSALLDDADEPIPPSLAENRRQSNLQPATRNSQPGLIGSFGAPGGGFAPAPGTWNPPGMPFAQGSGLGQQNWGALPTPGMTGWANNNAAFAANSAFGPIGATQIHRPAGAGLNRPLTIRLAVCQACKQLTTANRGEGDGYHNIDMLLRQMESNRPMLDSPPTLREIEEICETEGDSQNGGGELSVRKDAASDKFSVKWAPDATTPDQGRQLSSLGEIGSPMPAKTSPSSFGAPGMGRGGGSAFQNLGAVGSPTSF